MKALLCLFLCLAFPYEAHAQDLSTHYVNFTYSAATSLTVRGAYGDVVVHVRQSTGMTLTVVGSRASVDSVHVALSDNQLVITREKSETLPSGVAIVVDVPAGSMVDISVTGPVDVGDTRGPFVGHVSGSGDMFVGNVGNADLSSSGNGNIIVKKVTGTLSMTTMGSGEINVSSGNVSVLRAIIVGSGRIDFGGVATDTKLTIVGSGSIR